VSTQAKQRFENHTQFAIAKMYRSHHRCRRLLTNHTQTISMKKLIRTLLLAASTFAFTSCFQHEITIHVKSDGSGTIVEETRLGAQMLEMMQQMAAGFGGDAEKADPTKDMLSEDKAKGRAGKLGEGVQFVKIEPVEDNGSKGARATYAFKDISKLTLSTSEGSKAMQMPGTPKPEKAPKEAPIRFEFANSELTVHMPKPDRNAAEKPEAPAEQADMDNPEAKAMMKQMFGDMKMSIKIKAESGIASSDATHQIDDTVTLMEMNFGKLIENEENLKKLATMDQNDPQKAMESLKGIEGISFEVKPTIKIKLK
jgi:hypothetical protein